jgi:hypothetical protein
MQYTYLLLNPRNPLIRKIRDSDTLIKGNKTWNPVGEKTRSIASLRGKIVTIIGKCAGIMGGRIQFAPTIILNFKTKTFSLILKILKILIPNLAESR